MTRRYQKATPAGDKKTRSKSGRLYSTYDQEYQARPEQVKKRVQRNKDRAEAIKEGRAKKGDGKDVHHVRGAGRGDGPTRVVSASANRSRKK